VEGWLEGTSIKTTVVNLGVPDPAGVVGLPAVARQGGRSPHPRQGDTAEAETFQQRSAGNPLAQTTPPTRAPATRITR
jgi:hypothetical protein